ncbi:hypothetical protein HA402_000521 [Bradysia odoriphaga]|nr:hypothetical protein HA402_000521 [Bradysia odoriphaga]
MGRRIGWARPRILATDGNLIVESAKDRNISFRLQGIGCLNINDINILKIIEGAADHVGSPRNVIDRIKTAEENIADLKAADLSHGVRLVRLENGTNRNSGRVTPIVNTRLRNFQRRIMTLETKVERILNNLSEDDCRSNPCQNGGTCVDMYTDFTCKCPSNWEGKTCANDVNECAMFAGTELGCQNGASCVNSPGSYSCACTPGWQGIHCAKRTVDCASAGSEFCGHGSCIPTGDQVGYKCICDQGWKSNGISLACSVDIDECSEMKPYCSKDPPVQCINLPGTFMCGQCPAGFTGNGHYCSDINECEVNNGGCSTAPSVECINTRGSYRCGSCPPGWQGDGRYCIRATQTDAGSSGSGTGGGFINGICSRQNFCHPLAICSETPTGPICICPAGYVGSGFGSMGCSPGEILRHPCSNNPCINGGTCSSNGTSFTCTCPVGTNPPLCAYAFNPCAPNPCRNGGSCVRLRGFNYRCSCSPSFTGNLCETERSECGGVLSGQNGTLKYPLSDTYPHNSRCAWVIRTNASQVLNITFTKFAVEPSGPPCRFDWLQIHDGRTSSSHLIGRFCGIKLPKDGNFTSTTNTLYLWFRSDNSSSHDGFELNWSSIDPICGGTFEVDSHGIIASPGSPGNYPSNRDCEWDITAPFGKRIQFQFFTMQLEAHETCQYDYVAIYSGSSTSGTLLNKYCNTSHPEPLTTPENHAVVTFHSDEAGTDAGFQIHYTIVEGIPGCGGVFTASIGEFGPPTQNGVYQRNLLCEYLIRMPVGSRIEIKFKSFELEESRECDYDYIEIFEGSSDKDPKVSKYCGNSIPPSYTSLGNVLLVVFKSDWSANFEGFRISYEIVCGGLFENATGVITSPFYPNPYEHSRTCLYEILAPPGKAISLVFDDFDIEDTSYPDCDFDFVKVYDGFEANATDIRKFCGTTLPPTAISTMNIMMVLFESDASISGKGFRAAYSFIDIKCGGVIKTLGHDIQPPKQMVSQTYEHDADCSWIIVAPPGFVIQLTFFSFHLEDSSDCSLDYVEIFEGFVHNGTKIHRYCGTNIPPVTQSSSNVIGIKFVTDSSVSADGFRVQYMFIDAKRVCGGSFYAPTGRLNSPGWPQKYSENKNCVWILNAPTGQQIELQIESFELEEHDGCVFDSLQIRNGGTMQSPILGKYCGTVIPKVIRSFTNQMHIEFKTDSSRNFKGFDIKWDSTISGCGGNINNAVRGSIHSPNYPNPYGINSQCDWRITVSKGSLVQLLFTDLELEEHYECYFDYIEIFDGRSSAAKSLGKYCALNLVPVPILSTSNEIFIRMISDVNNQGRGFDLRFNTVCSHEIKSHRGVIESPNFPAQYPDNLQCDWTIIAPRGNKIFVAFSQFEIEESYDDSDETKECTFDYVEIVQKKSDDKEVSQSEKYCKEMPKDFNSIGDTVVVRYYIQITFGLQIQKTILQIPGCGDMFTRPNGNFTSPNYPNEYPHGVTCEWSIVTDYGNVIELTVNDLDIEMGGTCYDKLEVSNDKNFSHPMNQFCHKFDKPAVVTSHGSELFVRFTTDFSYSGKGFSAFYTTKAIQCGGVFKTRSSSFTSPRYPNNYDSNMYCEWFLEVEDNHRLSLTFIDFSIEDGCIHDSVKIYNGYEKTDDRLMATLCGNEIPKTIYNSTDNKMLVVMQTDSSIEYKGFRANFRTACGGTIMVNESGTIEMDSFHGMEQKNCNWTLIAPKPGKPLPIQWNLFLYLSTSQKLNNKIIFIYRKVYDGSSTTAPLAKEICEKGHPPPIVSSGNSLTLSLSEDHMLSFRFVAFYSTMENTCGGKFSDLTGQIASPSYPRSYPTDVECVWELSASPGNRLILTIEKLDIELSDKCNEDYLEIRENSISGNLVGVYCGNDVPSDLPQAERYWLKFKSNSDGVGTGFLAQYTYATSVEITGSSGIITSPLYPTPFERVSQVYTHRITVRFGYYISIAIKEFLSKSGNGNFLVCLVPYQIHDGYDDSAPVEEIDATTTNPIVSSSNIVFISSSTDYFSEISFKLEWNEVSEKRQEVKNETQTTNCTENSIIYLNNVTAVNISSPGYPYGYDANNNCTWTLKPEQAGYHAVFQFLEIDLEDSFNCLSDYVKVSSSSDLSTYKMLNRTCQETPNVILQLHGNPFLQVNFISDYYANRTGFLGLAKAQCGAPMTGPSGVITVHREFNCEWSITVRRGRTIKFAFLHFDIPTNGNSECRSYVILKNGASMESPFLGQGKFCGTTTPTVDKTSSNRALVVFKEDAALARVSSFALRYEEVTFDCGGTIVFNGENSSIISSPNFPNIPHPHIECVWTVIVPSGELIQVDFIERFDVTNSKDCDQEYVEIRDGGTTNGNVIGKFCGKMPPSQYSTSNMVRIKYYTDIPVPMNGFKANITLAKCGGFYRSSRGTIQSSNYPGLGGYEKNSVCEYHISGPTGSALNLTFVDLNLPSAYNCSTTDHIEIYSVVQGPRNTNDSTNDQIGTYCGNDDLPESILTSSEVLVRFVTMNGNNMYRGFRISFTNSLEKCGGEISSESGYITSPGYPNGRPFRQYCEWRITVPKGRRVKAEILDFDFVGTPPMTRIPPRLQTRIIVPQSLTFYNDFTYTSRIKRLWQNETSEAVYSSDNRLLISLWLRNNAGHRGFRLKYSSDEPTICIGNLNSNEGTIESPKNVSSYYCEYQRDQNVPFVRSESNVGTMGIYITELAIASSFCPVLSPIVVQYQPFTRNRMFTKNCNGTNQFPPVASPFAEVKISAKKGGYHGEVSPYTINYKVHNCGTLIKNTQDVTIRQPTFPQNYGRVACAWQYTTVESAPIAVGLDFTTEGYGNIDCATESITIYSSSFPPGIGKEKYCGTSAKNLNYALPRSASAVFIEYHSTNYNPNTTFELHIKANYSVCGGTIEHPLFEFSSPLNGSQYPNNIECIWDISTSIGYHIGLSFINRFFLEDSTDCTKDYIEIQDYVDENWQKMTRVCGRATPKPLNSTGNKMRVIFRTNENTVGEGFTIKWDENCGGVFAVTKDTQFLTSPKYPNRYPRNLRCNYTLLAGKNDFINVDFDEFELEDTSRSCVYDNLTIYKYEEWSFPANTPMLVGVYCWKQSLTHIRHKHKLNLIFSSDAFIEKKGFSSKYYLDNCGGNVTNSSMIEVPKKEQGKYAAFLNCVWLITAPQDKKITIRFEYFDIEHNDQCYLDAVEVYQGLKTDDTHRKALLCGNLTQHAPIINIASNNAVVKFRSDGNINSGGFSALILFGENCDKTIELNDRSPSYKLDKISTAYPPLLDCQYVITVPEGFVIKVEFEHFHLAPCHRDNSSCTCDFVAVLDGSDAFAEPIQKNLCGHNLPQNIISSGRSLFIRYVTDSIASSSGFSANIKMEAAECGKTVIHLNATTPEHTLTWPIGSSNYRPNSQCDWIIEAPDMEQIDIHFEKFDLEDADSGGQCSLDYLKLTDDDANLFNSEGLGSQFIFSGGKSRVLKPYFYWGRSFPTAPHDYCGAGIPNDFVSSSKRVKVRFRSNDSNQKSGFQFIARMTPACHRNYTSLQGRLYTKQLSDCETYITVPENYTISLYFGVFNIYLSDFSFQCTEETAPIKVFDNRRNRLLQHVCPGSMPNPIFANSSSLLIKTKKMDVSWVDTNGAYDITYLATNTGLGCGGQIFNYAGQFSSPMYPANDRNASDCRWDIIVPPNLVVSLAFTVFDMGSSVHCADNYVQIIESDYEGKETIARQYCGEDVPSAYKSNRNLLSIRFKKTSNFAGTGWNLQFMAVHPVAVVS